MDDDHRPLGWWWLAYLAALAGSVATGAGLSYLVMRWLIPLPQESP